MGLKKLWRKFFGGKQPEFKQVYLVSEKKSELSIDTPPSAFSVSRAKPIVSVEEQALREVFADFKDKKNHES